MKCISFILIILCLCYQTKQQVVASTANIYALQTNTISTPNKYVSIAKAQQGGYLGYDEEAEIARDREWYKQHQQELETAKVEQAIASRNAILTYGSIGIVLLFIIIAIAAFSILYVRRNKDNPKYRKP